MKVKIQIKQRSRKTGMIFFLLFLIVSGFISCKKYLELKPDSKKFLQKWMDKFAVWVRQHA